MDTRASYDTVAADYRDMIAGELVDKPFDRAMLAAFAELVVGAGGGPVADIGCGPGHVTAYLARLGLDPFGIDLSPGMVAIARADHPNLRFEVGSMTALALADWTLAGIVARYSTIHLSDDELAIAFGEFARVVRAGGFVLLDFQVGDELVTRNEAYGHEVSLVSHRRPVAKATAALELAGFEIVAQLIRAPDAREKVEQCHLIAQHPA